LQLILSIFQHLGHLLPSAFLTTILVSASVLFFILIAFDVIKYSGRSKPSNKLNPFSFIEISISVSRLDPISLLVLFSSIAIFASCLILYSSFHFSSSLLLPQVLVFQQKLTHGYFYYFLYQLS